jgi:hypothetical protein
MPTMNSDTKNAVSMSNAVYGAVDRVVYGSVHNDLHNAVSNTLSGAVLWALSGAVSSAVVYEAHPALCKFLNSHLS